MNGSGRLVVVSHRAPIEAGRGPDGSGFRRTVGGLGTALTAAMRARAGIWVGWAGPGTEDVLPAEVTGLPFPIRTVKLREREVGHYYAGFANQVLWPLCHMFPARCHFEPSFWIAYQQANERFAAAVLAVAGSADVVWINDFHLGLVPGLLRAATLGARVGVFWHIPFPPPSIFGICRWRTELLSGLLGADVIGLQTEADVQNFLACVRRFLDLPVSEDRPTVRLPGREVRVVALPIGIDAAGFGAQARDATVRAQAARLRQTLGTEIVMLGVDRLDYTKGVLERLLGFESFLERRPEWRRRVSLVQITVPSSFRVPGSGDMKREIDQTVGRILGRFTWEGRVPLAYYYTAFDHEQLATYYVAADVALVTPLRDGMNLVAKEYVACHAEGDGALILSEFAGAAAELSHALLVNPYDPEAIRRQIEVAVVLSPAERRRRMEALGRVVTTRDAGWWTSTFLGLLAAG